MPKPEPKPFDDLINSLYKDLSGGRTHAQAAAKAVRLTRASYWRAAKQFNELIGHHTNAFRERIINDYGPSSDPFNVFVEKEFQGLGMIGDDPWEVIAAVRNGMTQLAYLARGPVVFNQKTKRGRKHVKRPRVAALPPEPVESMDLAEQVRMLRNRDEVRTQVMRDMERNYNEMRRHCAQLQRELAKVNRILNSMEVSV